MSSGLNSQFGLVAETTYGTGVTVSKFPRVTTWSLNQTAVRVQGEGIQPGKYGPSASQFAQAWSAGQGSVEMEVQTAAILPLLKVLMGTSSTAQQGGTAAYLHTFTLDNTYGDSLTVQGGRPQRDGTVVPARLVGVKVPRASFTASMNENLKMSCEFDGKAWDNTTALAASSYVASSVFGWQMLTVKMGTYGAEASVNGITGLSLDINRAHDTEKVYAGSAGVKEQPVLNALAEISGSFSADWLAKTTFEDKASSISGTSLVLEWVGANIASTYYQTFRITVPGIHFEPQSQGVPGPAELSTDWAWTWKDDGTNLPKIEVINTETTV